MTESPPDAATATAANTTSGTTAAAIDPPPPPPPPTPVVLLQPSQRKNASRRPAKLFRTVRSALRSFPILPTPSSCRLPSPSNLLLLHHHHHHHHHHRRHDGHIHGAARTTGTLFGHRKARITIAFQDTPRSVPRMLVELGTPTAKFIQEMGASGLLRVALECEKKPAAAGERSSSSSPRLLEEPVWSATINGRSVGYAARREAKESDVRVMQLLHAVSMGAGVLPADMTDPADGELTYMRAYFDRVVGSRDSETFYMLNPDGNNGPELTIFFVRI